MKILIFGTFDSVHPGHLHFIRESKKHGDFLTVCLAREITVQKFKNKTPKLSEQNRKLSLLQINEVDEVLFGDKTDYYKILDVVKPDVICLGYDQKIFVNQLKKEIQKRNLQTRIIRISAFKPEMYKSSLLA